MLSGSFGDDRAGFTVDVSPSSIEVSAWGFWPAALGETLVDQVTSACAGRTGAWTFVFNLERFKPMRDEVSAAFLRLAHALVEGGIARVVVRTDSELVKLQLMRLAREAGAGEQFAYETIGAGEMSSGGEVRKS